MTQSLFLILTAIVLLGVSGLPACLLSARSAAGQRIATTLMIIGSVLGIGGLAMSFAAPVASSLKLSWSLPWGMFAVTVDSISVVFLAPVFVVPALGSIYGLEYWKQSENSKNGRWLGLFYGLLAGAMAAVVIARDAVLFLIAWEVMALAAYFAATVDEDNPDVRRAGWVYLIATHIGTLFLIAMFGWWRHVTGSFALELAPLMPVESAGMIFVLALIGFGFKAGLMPLHVWLPGAHANAPSHVSAVMSGVMLKMGIYGIVRMTALLPVGPEWWGGVLLGVGAISGVVGIAFAMGQQDIKRVLAYSSIENIGIIAMGLGLALFGRSLHRPDWVMLGFGAALFHVWNHSLFKSLLFMNAGAIIHAAQTRDMERLGGLAGRMPRVMILFVIGAVAICALPPLNGFASEWLLYLGLFRALSLGGTYGFPAAATAAAALAMIGALAVACFVKLLGTVFLGSPRGKSGDPAGHAHDPGFAMMVPMILLATGCICLGLFPIVLAPLLESAGWVWTASPEFSTQPMIMMAPLEVFSVMASVLCVIIATIILAIKLLSRGHIEAEAGTWDCGYAAPTPRMQYTGSSLSQSLVTLFAFILHPKYDRSMAEEPFPAHGKFKSVVPDTVLDSIVLPLFQGIGRQLPRVRVLQQGQTQTYVLYILLILIILLLWGSMGTQA